MPPITYTVTTVQLPRGTATSSRGDYSPSTNSLPPSPMAAAAAAAATAAEHYVALDDDMVPGYNPRLSANYGPTTPVADYFENEKNHPGVQWLLNNGNVQVVKTSNHVDNNALALPLLRLPHVHEGCLRLPHVEQLHHPEGDVPQARPRIYALYVWMTAKGAADAYNYMRKFRYLPRETTGDTIHYMVLFRPTTSMMLSLLHAQKTHVFNRHYNNYCWCVNLKNLVIDTTRSSPCSF